MDSDASPGEALMIKLSEKGKLEQVATAKTLEQQIVWSIFDGPVVQKEHTFKPESCRRALNGIEFNDHRTTADATIGRVRFKWDNHVFKTCLVRVFGSLY